MPGPTTELGVAAEYASALPGWASISPTEGEYVPELSWPTSVDTYHRMRNDAQLDSLFLASTLPIRRYNWQIDPNGARPNIVKQVAEDLGLPILGQRDDTRPRRKGRFSHEFHLRHALLALMYGHMFMEQVGAIEGGQWRMKKLAPRMPHTIDQIDVANDGGLNWIKQIQGDAKKIPIERLVAYVWDREGANWFGRSMFRSCYANWLIKDRLLRIDVIRHERNGIGVPMIEAPERVTGPQMEALNDLAQRYKVGEASGGVLPHGARLRLVGVEGSVSDALASIKYHDEAMARKFLAMFVQLGVTKSGSRALGESFMDFFSASQQGIGRWYADVTNEHVIEDWVDWNYGPGEQAPLIMFDVDEETETLPTVDLFTGIERGLITVDDELEDWFRHGHKMPEIPVTGRLSPEEKKEQQQKLLDAPAPSEQPQPQLPAAPPDAQARIAASQDPSWPYRRGLTEVEAMAGTDFQALDAEWQSRLDQLLQEWAFVQGAQITELVNQVEAAKSREGLAAITPSTRGQATILAAMHDLIESGAREASREALGQGKTIPVPDLTGYKSSAATRAKAVDELLARGLAQSAFAAAMRMVPDSGKGSPTVAAGVRAHLQGLSGSYVNDQLGGVLTQAQNMGRRAVISKGQAPRVFASELLDTNTCAPCRSIDGREYADLDEAASDYPSGSFARCQGGPRCRGVLLAIYSQGSG